MPKSIRAKARAALTAHKRAVSRRKWYCMPCKREFASKRGLHVHIGHMHHKRKCKCTCRPRHRNQYDD